MRHPKAEAWERKLKAVFDRIDEHLERAYGHKYTLHPARAPHGSSASREQDGLFDVGASYSAGMGSEHGASYVVDIRLATLATVPAEVMEKIEREVVRLLREELPRAFPGRRLSVTRDGAVYRIAGDLSLGHI